MYAVIERLAILHISKFICTLEKEKKDVAIPESGPKKNFRVNGFTKTVTPHLRSLNPTAHGLLRWGLWAAHGLRITILTGVCSKGG